MTTDRRRRFRASPLVVLLAGLGVVTAPFSTGAGAEEADFGGGFRASAVADVVRVDAVSQGFPATSSPLGSGGPSAQAVLTSLGVSTAYASFPYPGETAVSGPGVIRGLAGIPAPYYPLYASTDYPTTAKSDVQEPGINLVAESSNVSSTSTATAGTRNETLAVGMSRASATVTKGTDNVVARATTEVEALTVGVVRLGRVISAAEATLAPDGTITRRAAATVAGVVIGDSAVTIGPRGLEGAGGAPVPVALPEPLAQVLKQAGISMSFVGQQSTPNGVVAPVLEISQVVSPPSGPPITMRYLLGGALVNVESSVAGSESDTSVEALPVSGVGVSPAAPSGRSEGPSDGSIPRFTSDELTPAPVSLSVRRPTSALTASSGSPTGDWTPRVEGRSAVDVSAVDGGLATESFRPVAPAWSDAAATAIRTWSVSGAYGALGLFTLLGLVLWQLLRVASVKKPSRTRGEP